MDKLAKSLKNSIWYASKILNGTRYAEQNWKVRGTPWGEGVIASLPKTAKVDTLVVGFETRLKTATCYACTISRVSQAKST